jgi:hypothetical protein
MNETGHPPERPADNNITAASIPKQAEDVTRGELASIGSPARKGRGLNPHSYLADLLEETKVFVRRFVVVVESELVAIALWNAHTFVFQTATATPYLHVFSPEPGSGKTTLLDVLDLTASNAIQADNLTEAVLFRMIDKTAPTLLFDEVDAVFGKKNSDSIEGIRQVLNSGYRAGKVAFRCVPPSHEIKSFNVYCPKATAGLNELPGTLAHRSIPISMKPPAPDELYEDLDRDEVADVAEILRRNLEGWADEVEDDLRDPRLKPPRLDGLDARGNEIWRILFRIADMAGGDWPELARVAALELSAGERRHKDASTGVKLLAAVRDVWNGERMKCAEVAEALNEIEEAPYGGWNDARGISTRELGKHLARYGIRAKPIRIDGERAGNGYEREQFEDVWSRYLRNIDLETGTTGTSLYLSQKTAVSTPVHRPPVPVAGNGANPHEQPDVSVVLVVGPDLGNGAILGDLERARLFDEMYPPTGKVAASEAAERPQ